MRHLAGHGVRVGRAPVLPSLDGLASTGPGWLLSPAVCISRHPLGKQFVEVTDSSLSDDNEPATACIQRSLLPPTSLRWEG